MHSLAHPFRRAATPSTAVGAGLTALGLGIAVFFLVRTLAPKVQERLAKRVRVRDYSDRSGFPQGVEAARGAASDFQVPRDLRAPEPLRPTVH